MSFDKNMKEVLYKSQMNQKISIYMALFSNFGMIITGFLLFLFWNDVFTSIVPVFILDFAIMLYFFRSFVGVKKHDYERLPIFIKLKQLRKFVRSKI